MLDAIGYLDINDTCNINNITIKVKQIATICKVEIEDILVSETTMEIRIVSDKEHKIEAFAEHFELCFPDKNPFVDTEC